MTGDGTGNPERVVEHSVWPHRDPSRRGAKADHVGPGRGVAERAAHIRAVRERKHPACDRNCGATAAAPAGASGRVWIPGGSEHLIEGLRASPELGGIGLADDDRAGRLEPLDVELVFLGNEVAIDRRPERGADAPGQGEVLDRDRQPVERPRRLASGKGGVRRPRTLEGGLGKQGDDRVDRGVHLLDTGEEPGHELLGAKLALDQPAHQVAGRGEDDLGVGGQGVRHGVHDLMSVWVEASIQLCVRLEWLPAGGLLLCQHSGSGTTSHRV